MIKAIKAWWRSFRRDCVRTSLIRHYGWTADEITEKVLDDVERITFKVKIRPLNVTTTEVIAAYKFNRDVVLIFAAVDFLLEKDSLVTREMILWAINQKRKVQ